jgi:hypothetical protein
MSFSWTYLTRRFVGLNYRDFFATAMISSWFASKGLNYISTRDDNEWTNQRVYTNDQTDIMYREHDNKTDGAVKREHALRYTAKIKAMRAE